MPKPKTPSSLPAPKFIKRSTETVLGAVLAVDQFRAEQDPETMSGSSGGDKTVLITPFPPGAEGVPKINPTFMRFPPVVSDPKFLSSGNYKLEARVVISPGGADAPYKKDSWKFTFVATATLSKLNPTSGDYTPVSGASATYVSTILAWKKVENGEYSLGRAFYENPVPPQATIPSAPGKFTVTGFFSIEGVHGKIYIQGKPTVGGMTEVVASVTDWAIAGTSQFDAEMGFKLVDN
jgi:hypothetical protein